MGRYAYFNSGFEYKFVFAIQDSYDIQDFGGEDTTEKETCETIDCDNESCDGSHGDNSGHRWEKNPDEHLIQDTLDEMRKENEWLPKINFEDFEKTIEGTDKLYESFDESWETYNKNNDDMTGDNARILAKYMLGCLIKHQLSYEADLCCGYEV